MGREQLTERLVGENSKKLDVLSDYYGGVTFKEIVGKAALAIGGVAAVCGAVEIARYYNLSEYIRRFL